MADGVIGGRKFRKVNGDGPTRRDVAGASDSGGEDFVIIDGEHGANTPDSGGSDGDARNAGPIDPASIPDVGSGDAAPKRGRGRPRGSRNASSGGRAGNDSTQRASATKATDSIEALLFTVHTFGAMMTKTPELMLSEGEAKELAKAVTRVTQLYDLPLMDEKTLAWIGLFMVAGKVYGPRMVAVAVNTKKAKASQPKGPTVVPPRPAAPVSQPIPDFTHAAAGVQ